MSKILLWVEGKVCDSLARQTVFVDLLALKANVKADRSIFTAIVPDWNVTHEAMHKIISSAYDIHVESYADDIKDREQAVLTAYLRSTVAVLKWVGETSDDVNNNDPTVILVVESTATIAVIKELYELGVKIVVYTANDRIIAELANMHALDNNEYVKYRPLSMLPKRIPMPRRESRAVVR
jgi:hypothetical protein